MDWWRVTYVIDVSLIKIGNVELRLIVLHLKKASALIIIEALSLILANVSLVRETPINFRRVMRRIPRVLDDLRLAQLAAIDTIKLYENTVMIIPKPISHIATVGEHFAIVVRQTM